MVDIGSRANGNNTHFVLWSVNDNLDPAVDSLICIGGGAR